MHVLSHSSYPPQTKTTPLQLAAKEGHVAVTRLLLERGASLLARDSTGRNALELAIAAGKKYEYILLSCNDLHISSYDFFLFLVAMLHGVMLRIVPCTLS